jgi:hypothetical protein
MKRNSPKLQHGSSLLELVLALGISSMVIASTLAFIATRVSLERREEEAIKEATTGLLMHALASQAMRALDTHRFNLLPRIHGQGSVKYTDGTFVDELYRNESHSPAPWSDAITWVALDSLCALRLEQCSTDGTTLTAHACFSGPTRGAMSDFENLLLIAPESLRVQRGVIRGSGLCRTVVAFHGASHFDSSPDQPLSCSSVFAVPVTLIETLYLDRQQNLRIARYRGARVTSNQPLSHLGPSPGLSLSLTLSTTRGVYELQHRIVDNLATNQQPVSKGAVSNSLGRRSHLDLFLNL